jgi:hypothetical protein
MLRRFAAASAITLAATALATLSPVIAQAGSVAAHASRGSAVAPSVYSITSGWYYICDYSDNLCMDNQGNSGVSNNPIIAWPSSSSDGAVQWELVGEGTVTSSGCWPFTCGSGMNSKYNNDAVVHMENRNYVACAGQITYDYAALQSCSTSNWQDGNDWVEAGETIVNVVSSNWYGTPTCLATSSTKGLQEFIKPCVFGNIQNWYYTLVF